MDDRLAEACLTAYKQAYMMFNHLVSKHGYGVRAFEKMIDMQEYALQYMQYSGKSAGAVMQDLINARLSRETNLDPEKDSSK